MNNDGMQEGNVAQCSTPISYIAAPNEGDDTSNVTDFPVASAGNETDVAISVESIRAISESFANIIYGFFLEKQVPYPVVDNYVRNTLSKFGFVKSMLNSSNGLLFFKFSSKDGMDAMLENDPCYARAMIELRADVELNGVCQVMPKLVNEGFYMCTIRVDYEWKPPRCSSCKVFGHVLDECPKNIISDVVKSLKNPRQAARGVVTPPNWVAAE
ncbi:reverse transcriptase domain, reverse transcriptase zinc-binding domain protein [Tanacetum coccineum]